MGTAGDPVPVTEPVAIADTFVSRLHSIEELGGGCMRFTFITVQRSIFGQLEHVVSARIIMHKDAVPVGLYDTAKAIGWHLIGEIQTSMGMGDGKRSNH